MPPESVHSSAGRHARGSPSRAKDSAAHSSDLPSTSTQVLEYICLDAQGETITRVQSDRVVALRCTGSSRRRGRQRAGKRRKRRVREPRASAVAVLAARRAARPDAGRARAAPLGLPDLRGREGARRAPAKQSVLYTHTRTHIHSYNTLTGSSPTFRLEPRVSPRARTRPHTSHIRPTQRRPGPPETTRAPHEAAFAHDPPAFDNPHVSLYFPFHSILYEEKRRGLACGLFDASGCHMLVFRVITVYLLVITD